MKLPSLLLRALCALAATLVVLPAGAGTFVRLQTTQGAVDIALLDSAAPVTVANFLGYVQRGDYTNTLIHRSVPNFVIQGGGFRWASGLPGVTQQPPIVNEYGDERPNARGTMAMARGSSLNSATSQWFINTVDNTNTLGRNNVSGPYAVFANVTVPGMVAADRIAALPLAHCGQPFENLPMVSNPTCEVLARNNVVLVSSAVVLPSATTEDRIFNYLEALFPSYVPNVTGAGGTAQGYIFRDYGGMYVGIKDGNVYYYIPAVHSGPVLFESVANLFAAAQAAGY